MNLVSVRRDVFTGQWMVRCAVCGRLAALSGFWPASRMAADHEAMHAETERVRAIGGDG